MHHYIYVGRPRRLLLNNGSLGIDVGEAGRSASSGGGSDGSGRTLRCAFLLPFRRHPCRRATPSRRQPRSATSTGRAVHDYACTAAA